MDLALHPAPRALSNVNTRAPVAPAAPTRATRSKGCWTCRLRRKKCDEKRPVCDTCTALLITCHNHEAKPAWMDGGALQEEMAEQLKREVKERAAQRRAAQAYNSSGDVPLPLRPPGNLSSFAEQNSSPETSAENVDASMATTPELSDVHVGTPPSVSSLGGGGGGTQQRAQDCSLGGKFARGSVPFARSDTVLLVFYLEHLFPFLFPFYQPSILEGGRAWILEMMISSPVVRQATLCQSSYFYSLARPIQDAEMIWKTMLEQTGDAFGVLRQSLSIFETSSITDHVHGAVRIISGILQVQRFEIAVMGFNNCRAHLNAARVLFKQLLDSQTSEEGQVMTPSEKFNQVYHSLGPPAWIEPGPISIPSAEQAAFRFSSALLVLDDIVASTVLQEKPTLYEYHENLLGQGYSGDVAETPIDLEAVVGCQNWALRYIAEIAVLDDWKKQCRTGGSLNVMELVNRATPIKTGLEYHLQQLEAQPNSVPLSATGNLLDLFIITTTTGHASVPSALGGQSSLVTRVWAHAALAYLYVVVSGWQPASMDVRHHVSQVLSLLSCGISTPALLRTMVWPFCVAGCLAEPGQEARVRNMVEALQPPSVFGTVRKALEIMENVWRHREAALAANFDLAACFAIQDNLVLLV